MNLEEMNDLAALETPALVLDEIKMDANIARMRAALEPAGVRFRPHVKTNKSLHVTRRILGADSGPITVSTLKEAEYFAAHGHTDILYAVGLAPNKLRHVFALCERGIALTVILDSVDMARRLAQEAQALANGVPRTDGLATQGPATGVRAGKLAPGAALPAVMIEIDADGHRSGVRPGSADLVAIATVLRGAGIAPKGVLTHAGSSYACRSLDAIAAMACLERDAAVACARQLREQGFACPEVSVGSTPTALFARDLAGVTEVRAGVFVFGDLVMSGLGVTAQDAIAVSVLTTVLGHQRDKGWIIVDAGWMALSRDRGTSRQPVDQGYGVVCDVAGRVLDELIVVDANQEHGVIAHRSGDPTRTPDLPVGTPLRILPNHACATCAQHDRYHVVRGSTRIGAVWPRIGGW